MTDFADHEPCIICRGLGARFSECLSELGRAKGSRTQCRSITEIEREREREREREEAKWAGSKRSH